jgi:hypothetical protein
VSTLRGYALLSGVLSGVKSYNDLFNLDTPPIGTWRVDISMLSLGDRCLLMSMLLDEP